MNARHPQRERALEHVLFRALTRPALVAGVPIEAVLFCGMGGQFFALAMGSQAMALVGGGILWAVTAGVSVKDPLFFRVLIAWINTRPQHPDLGRAAWRHWGGASMSSLRPSCGYRSTELGRAWSPVAGSVEIHHA